MKREAFSFIILIVESGGRMSKKGFTLVEVIMMVVILGIIIGIAVPSYIAVSNNIKEKNYNQKMDNIKSKALEYATDNNVESITIPVKALIEPSDGSLTISLASFKAPKVFVILSATLRPLSYKLLKESKADCKTFKIDIEAKM